MSAASPTIVRGIGLWTPGIPDASAWREGRRDPEVTRPDASVLGKRLRRRASPLTRVLAEAFGQSAEQSGADPGVVPAVFGSALGEAKTMVDLLEQIWRERAEPSPTKFAMSVHNAASGMVSIATSNRGFTTSLAADYDTPAMALMEGLGLVASRGEPVVVTCGDEAAPADLVPEDEHFGMLAAAVVLGPPAGEGPELARMGPPCRAGPDLEGAEAPAELARNPQMGMLDLVDAVVRGRRGTLRLDRGRGRGWSVELEPGSSD